MKVITYLEKEPIISWSLTILLAVAIFIVSSFEGGANSNVLLQHTGSLQAILYHTVIYFLFALMFFISFFRGKNLSKGLIVISIVFLLFYGLLDEVHQIIIPGRFYSLGDVLFDAIGICLAAIVYQTLQQKTFFNRKFIRKQ